MRLSADPSGEIDELVEQLESVDSPWQKVKVLAKSWRTVRKLQPDERFLIAKNLGLEGAEAFVDKLGDPYIGVPADDLLDIVRAADAQDFSRWKEVVGRLRRPEERQKVLRKGLEEAREALLQEQQEAESIEIDSSEDQPEPVETASEEIVEAEEEPVAEVSEEIDIDIDIGEEEEEEATVISPVVEEAAEEELEVSASEADEVATNIPTPATAHFEDALEKLATSTSLVSRFRRVRELIVGMRHLEIEHLERLLETFPEGWARRRAITQMLRAGVPEDFDDAMILVGTQRCVSGRIWCLTALVEGRDLDKDEIAFLLSSEEPPLIKRRLESRLRESR